MAKINITNKAGVSETLTLLSAFKAEGNTYVIFDSEKLGSMGLPIIYISKYTGKLEKITDTNEWQSVKNYLKGIINGTSFEYIKIEDNLTSDEVYYTPLTLPVASFDIIKSRYVVNEEPVGGSAIPTIEPVVNVAPTEPVMPNNDVVSNTTENITPVVEPIAPLNQDAIPNVEQMPSIEPVTPTTASIPSIDPVPSVNPIPNITPEPAQPIAPITPIAEPPKIEEVPNMNAIPTVEPINNVNQVSPSPVSGPAMNFDNDKETFLKACENMFDALISKYQKELADLEYREQELARKEQEINSRLQSANEHLANAEAREQVANIAHENAQKVMDLSTLMPNNDNVTNPAGVI